jgi:hypothetical protein
MSWLAQLDELLRGRMTSPERLAEGRLALSLRRFVPVAAGLGALYGFFMGWYALTLYFGGTTPESNRLWQALASTVKLPVLFLLTLVVTFPSLYVFNALFGSRLTFVDTLRLLVGAVTINVAVAASLGPILGFFTLSTTSYSFMVLLNVALLSIAGFVALAFLLQTLRRLACPVAAPWPPETGAARIPPETGAADVPPPLPGPINAHSGTLPPQALGQARSIFRVWLIIYSLVGAQMGWILRPFIGNPRMPFEWFRPRSGNFFQGLISSIHALLGTH